MRKDEFGNSNIKNERFSGKAEFGKVQKTEFSDHSDTQDEHFSDLNSTKTINDDIDEGKGRGASQKDNKALEFAGKAANASTVVHAATVTASVVAVATVSTVVAINIVNTTEATVVFQRLSSYGESLEYGLVLRGADEKDPFSIKVENTEYSKSFQLKPGENWGMFEGLKEGSTYTVSVLQDRIGGANIYNESFLMVPYAEVFYASVESFDFSACTFEARIEYEDVAERLSNFALVIEKEGGKLFTYELQKTYETQLISFQQGDFSPGETCFYYLEYNDYASRKKTPKYELHLEEYYPDISEESSASEEYTYESSEEDYHGEVFELLWDFTASFATQEAEVNLSYDDPDGNFENFRLVFSEEYADPIGIQLEKTVEMQTIDLSPLDLSESHCDFYVYLLYYDHFRGEEVTMDIGDVHIENASISSFESIEFEEQFSMEYKTATVTLNFVDENQYFYDFSLELTDVTGSSIVQTLDPTTQPQEISLAGLPGVDPDGTTLQYKLTYYDLRKVDPFLVEGEVTLHDDEYVPAEGVINSLSFDGKMNFQTGKFSLTLDVDDRDDRIDNIIFTLTRADNADISQSFVLEKISDAQEFTFMTPKSSKYDVTNFAYVYSMTYLYDGEEMTFATPADSFMFVNSGTFVFRDFICDFAVSEEGYLPYRLDCEDPEGLYSSAIITISDSEGIVMQTEYNAPGSRLDSWDYLYLGEGSSVEINTPYELTVSMMGDTGAVDVYWARDVVFTNNALPSIAGVVITGDYVSQNDPMFEMRPYYTSINNLTDTKLIFRFSDSEIYELPFDLANLEGRENYLYVYPAMLLTQEEYDAFLEILGRSPVDVGVSYIDVNGQEQIRYSYIGMMFVTE